MTPQASTTENLLALREGLIAEIQEHMHANKATNSAAGLQQEDSIDPNLTYDLYEGHHKTLMGSMNSSETANAASREDSIDPNLTYDLAEGHDKSLKGSMNNSAQAVPKNYDAVLLALHQND